jgi:hypothetical protein
MSLAEAIEQLIHAEAAYMRATWDNAGKRLDEVHAARDALAAHPDNRRKSA